MPQRTDAPEREVALTGKVFPWDPTIDNPLLLRMEESPAHYLACFSSADALRAMMAKLGITGYTIKLIQDGLEFHSSLPSTVGGQILHVILDPYFTEQGRIRFTQVLGAN